MYFNFKPGDKVIVLDLPESIFTGILKESKKYPEYLEIEDYICNSRGFPKDSSIFSLPTVFPYSNETIKDLNKLFRTVILEEDPIETTIAILKTFDLCLVNVSTEDDPVYRLVSSWTCEDGIYTFYNDDIGRYTSVIPVDPFSLKQVSEPEVYINKYRKFKTMANVRRFNDQFRELK